MFHFWCPVPVYVWTNTQAYRETYLSSSLPGALYHSQSKLNRKHIVKISRVSRKRRESQSNLHTFTDEIQGLISAVDPNHVTARYSSSSKALVWTRSLGSRPSNCACSRLTDAPPQHSAVELRLLAPHRCAPSAFGRRVAPVHALVRDDARRFWAYDERLVVGGGDIADQSHVKVAEEVGPDRLDLRYRV
jgi:hypothetical protein